MSSIKCLERALDILELMYKKELISASASEEMIAILKNQQLNGKIPFFCTDSTEIAHKTGEDDGITHDVGIVFTIQPPKSTILHSSSSICSSE